jgi:TPR repeat protein
MKRTTIYSAIMVTTLVLAGIEAYCQVLPSDPTKLTVSPPQAQPKKQQAVKKITGDDATGNYYNSEGDKCYDSSDFLNAFEWYTKGAEKNIPFSQFWLGVIYQEGSGGITKDYMQAETLFGSAIIGIQRKAKNDDKIAECDLGLMYEWGYGVEKDYSKAMNWLEKSANQGFAMAQAGLAFMYENGLGTNINYQQALYWLKKSAAQGLAMGQTGMADMYSNGHGVEVDNIQALYWYRKAAEKNEPIAEYNIGYFYFVGTAVDRDYTQALYWFRKSSHTQYGPALNKLGFMYQFGFGVSRDVSWAKFWYKKACDGGEKEACENLTNLN